MSFRTVNARLRAAIEAAARDVKLIARGLRRHPLFAAVTIATLTIGLGAFGVVYTAVDKVLFEPLPYERPDDLYYVWRDWGPRLPNGWLDGTDVSALKASGGAIDGMVGIRRDGRTISDGLDGEPEELSVVASSPELFDLLGVPLALGRGFAADEVGPGRAPVVVLSYDLWQRRFGGDVSVVGSLIQLNGEPFLVIGVTPQSFRFVQPSSWSILGSAQRVDAYITFDVHLDFDDRSVMGLMRAQPGATPAQVAAAVGIVGATIQARDFPAFDLSFYPVGAMRSLVNRVRPVLVVLGAAGVFLVLVLMANLATVLLARASTREREFAVARALGASGLALTRPTLLEGGLLGILGGAGGALAAVWGTRALVALAPLELPRRDAIAVDGETVAVVIGVGALLGLFASAVPAAWATRTDLGTLLSHAAVRGGGGRGRMRRGLVVVQVALSLVLLSAGPGGAELRAAASG